ncbi:hypothetical protein Scep_014716 [Stephania cephalantha]|uniref:Mitochondrial protein n=1 Tax=Stephania cephalantha TaxID=152367 RepID=A0AAP0J2I8_9MAGN
MITRTKDGISKKKVIVSTVSYPDITPKSAKEALLTPHWKDAMDKEFQALLSNDTWSLVLASPHHNLVGNKWVFAIK